MMIRYLFVIHIILGFLNAQENEYTHITLLKEDSNTKALKSKKIYKNKFENSFHSALELLKTQEKKALPKFKKLIYEDPKKFKHLYKKYITTSKYNNFFDINLFNSLLLKYKKANIYTRDSAVNYVFFSSKKFMVADIEKLIKKFKQYTNNEKLNVEFIAILKANLLLLKQDPEKAYAILKKETPYSTQSIALIKFYSPFKEIPLYSSQKKLLESMDIKNIQLNTPVIPQEKIYYYDINGNKIEGK